MLFEGDIYFNIASRFGRVDCFHNALNKRAKLWPLLFAKNNERNDSARKILLVAHIPVGCQQYVKATLFSRGRQLAVT